MSELALEFEGVTKKYGNTGVITAPLNFSVRKGEFFSILGPSGCGKTTCLRLISGLEKPSGGVIRIGGKVVNELHPHKRNVHTVFQKYALFPHLNVFENVAFGLKMKKLKSSIIRERVTRMLKMVRLDDYATRSIQKLSGGEQQRVALVRALVNEPGILLLDEPLAALDLKLREQMQQELASLQKQLGTTFIFVTHDQAEALTLSDRVAIMNKGKLEQIGSATEVYENPSSAFVARFVGTTNIFEGECQRVVNNTSSESDLVRVATQGFGTLFAKTSADRIGALIDTRVGIVVRPEKIRLRVTAPPAPSQENPINVLRGTLIERVYFGPTTQIKLSIEDSLTPITVLVANQAAQKMPHFKVGERYYATWDAQDSVVVAASHQLESKLASERCSSESVSELVGTKRLALSGGSSNA